MRGVLGGGTGYNDVLNICVRTGAVATAWVRVITVEVETCRRADGVQLNCSGCCALLQWIGKFGVAEASVLSAGGVARLVCFVCHGRRRPRDHLRLASNLTGQLVSQLRD